MMLNVKISEIGLVLLEADTNHYLSMIKVSLRGSWCRKLLKKLLLVLPLEIAIVLNSKNSLKHPRLCVNKMVAQQKLKEFVLVYLILLKVKNKLQVHHLQQMMLNVLAPEIKCMMAQEDSK